MNTVHYLSAEGLEKLRAELVDLKTIKRREVASRIESAKALGDLSENAEYHEAKGELEQVERRVYEIEDILRNYSVIEEERGVKGVVNVGSTVVVSVHGKERTYIIVGSNEANPAAGKVSNESPIGQALLGAKVGDEVNVKTPTGMVAYEILSIK
ncbi:MAG: transcription elongation factor GreA [bacterium]|nr:transcription elongation factor GreA [bacterium]